MNNWILLLPFITALLAWVLTKGLLAWLLNSWLYRNKQELANGIARAAAKQVPFDMLENKIRDPKNFEKLAPAIEAHVDEFLKVKLTKQMPYLSMFIGDKTIGSLKKTFMDELAILFPQIMSNYAANLKKDLDPEQIIRGKLQEIEASEITQSLRKPLIAFQLWCAFLGFAAGLIALLLIMVVE